MIPGWIEPAMFRRHIAFMREMHEGQVDKAGAPYWLHPMRVARIAHGLRGGKDPVVLAAALFHDIIEDRRGGEAEIARHLEGCGCEKACEIMEAARVLTKRKKEKYPDYANRVFSSGNRAACLVKLADLRDHVERLDRIRDKDARLCLEAKYAPALRACASWLARTA